MAYIHTHQGAAQPHVHEGESSPHTHDELPTLGSSHTRDSQTHADGLHHPKRETNEKPLLSFDDFCFAYDEEATLRHIDLDIYAGDSVVLMGDNGSGKSTLLKAVNGLIFAQQGAYRFDGQLVNEVSMKDPAFAKRLHARVGFIFQDSDAQLFCSNVEDEIAFGPRQMGLSETEIAQRVDDVCRLLSIDTLRARAPYHLSGGEKKKVAIACVLSMNPDVYCFDEPLSGLDAKTREWLYGFLKTLATSGKTLIISTHDQSLADALADYFVYMGPQHEYSDIPHVHINR